MKDEEKKKTTEKIIQETHIDAHPMSWVGFYFTNKHTHQTDRVLKVRQNGSRYQVYLDSENDMNRMLGFDYMTFRKHWRLGIK